MSVRWFLTHVAEGADQVPGHGQLGPGLKLGESEISNPEAEIEGRGAWRVGRISCESLPLAARKRLTMLRLLFTAFVLVFCWLALSANAHESKDKTESPQRPSGADNGLLDNLKSASLIRAGMSVRQ